MLPENKQQNNNVQNESGLGAEPQTGINVSQHNTIQPRNQAELPQVDEIASPQSVVVFAKPLVESQSAYHGFPALLRRFPARVLVIAGLVLLLGSTAGATKYVLTHEMGANTKQDVPVVSRPTTTASSTNNVKPTNTTKPPSTTTTQPKKSTAASTNVIPKSTAKTKQSPPLSTSIGNYAIAEEPVYPLDGFNFYYGEAAQILSDGSNYGASGASINVTRADPKVINSYDHSLIELATGLAGNYNFIEIGWMVDLSQFGDSLPHLFVSRWIGPSNQCYAQSSGTACGFVQVSSIDTPDEAVSTSGTAKFEVKFASNNWYVYYDGDEVGYFPESTWGSGHTKVVLAKVYGEVAIKPGTSSCVQMGNGKSGTSSGSARVSNYTLIESPVPTAFSTFGETAAKHYYVGSPSATGFNLGGPGVC